MDLNIVGKAIPTEMGNGKIKRNRRVCAFASKIGEIGINIWNEWSISVIITIAAYS